MKNLAFLVISLLFVETIGAQNKKLDSLNRLITLSTSDTARINLTLKKIGILSNINLDSAIDLSKQVLEDSRKISYYRGELDARQRLATNYCFKGAYDLAEEQFSFLDHFIKPNDSLDLADLNANRGMKTGMQSKYDSSVIFYEKAIGIYERAGITWLLSNSYSNLAIAYQQQSNYPQALIYQQKSLAIAEKNKNEISQAFTLMNMANTFTNMGDTIRAERTYLDAIKLAKQNALTNVELYGYTNLASMYLNQKKWKQMYDFAMQAAALGASMGDQGIQAASLSKASTALAFTDRIEEALLLAKRSIALADSSGQPLNIFQAYTTLGNILRLKRNYAAAIPYYEKAFAAMKDSDMYTIDNGEVYNELSECYEKTGDYVKALANYKMAAQILDSVRRKENVQKSTELAVTNEFEKKQQVQQAQQKAKDEFAAAKQLALIIGLALVFLLAIVAFVGFRNKQKANGLLRSQKEEIENTLTLLKSTQSQLIQSEKMASLGELTAGIAHEIQNPLNFVNNFSEINKELIEELQQELKAGKTNEVLIISNDIMENQEKINHHGKRADAIVKSMLQHSRASTGKKELTNVNALADEYLRLAYHGLKAKDKSFNVIINQEFDQSIQQISIIPQDIGRVLLNLITNAFYAVNEKSKSAEGGYEPTVTVMTKNLKDKIVICVKDNGAGIPKNLLDKIFQPFFTTKPTGEGTGLGLSLSYDIVTKGHNGELTVETNEGEYSKFMISLPIQKINNPRHHETINSR